MENLKFTLYIDNEETPIGRMFLGRYDGAAQGLGMTEWNNRIVFDKREEAEATRNYWNSFNKDHISEVMCHFIEPSYLYIHRDNFEKNSNALLVFFAENNKIGSRSTFEGTITEIPKDSSETDEYRKFRWIRVHDDDGKVVVRFFPTEYAAIRACIEDILMNYHVSENAYTHIVNRKENKNES